MLQSSFGLEQVVCAGTWCGHGVASKRARMLDGMVMHVVGGPTTNGERLGMFDSLVDGNVSGFGGLRCMCTGVINTALSMMRFEFRGRCDLRGTSRITVMDWQWCFGSLLSGRALTEEAVDVVPGFTEQRRGGNTKYLTGGGVVVLAVYLDCIFRFHDPLFLHPSSFPWHCTAYGRVSASGIRLPAVSFRASFSFPLPDY